MVPLQLYRGYLTVNNGRSSLVTERVGRGSGVVGGGHDFRCVLRRSMRGLGQTHLSQRSLFVDSMRIVCPADAPQYAQMLVKHAQRSTRREFIINHSSYSYILEFIIKESDLREVILVDVKVRIRGTIRLSTDVKACRKEIGGCTN